MTVQDVWAWLNGFAPFDSAESFDNVGIIVGDPAATVSKALFCVDATLEAVEEAKRIGAELIVSHHPLLFGGTKTIRLDQPAGRVLQAMLAAGVSLIAAHTNLDQAVGGTGDSLAASLGLTDVTAPNPYLRVGTLPSPLTQDALADLLRERLGAPVRVYGAPPSSICRVGVGPGACFDDEIVDTVHCGAQAFVVGELHHHELIDACAMGLTVYEAGHYPTELPGIRALYHRFQAELPAIEPHLLALAPYRGAILPGVAQGS